MKKGLKKFFAVLMAFVVLSALILAVDAKEAVVFSFDSTIVNSGDETADIVLSIDENPGFAAADIQIVSDLQIVAIQDLGIGAIVNTASGKANWSSNTNKTTTGDILRITFAIPENAAPGSLWNIYLTVTELVDAQLHAVTYSVQNGTISVQGGETVRLAGDANKDGTVDLKDAVQIRRWIVGGWDVVIDLSNSDVNGDAKVNLKDVVLIRRHLAGDWNVTLV